MKRPITTLAFGVLTSFPALAQDADPDSNLAKQLANPLAALISVPIQVNYDEGFGPTGDGSILRTNIQPVIPFSLGDDWNLISRTILPVIQQDDLPTPGSSEFGLGDVVQSLWLSPTEPVGGWVMGFGGAFLLPTATDTDLGGEKWGLGPTFVGLKQAGPWTVGFLTNHISSFAGEDDRADVNATFVQPFLTYITPSKTTIALSTEATFDWQTDQWSVPVNFNISQLLTIGDQPVQIGAGVRYWAESADNGPDDWGFRLQMTFLFPK